MRATISKLLANRPVFYLIVLVLTLPAVKVLFNPGFFTVYDDMQVIRLEQMHKCILDWQLPCRWVPDLGYGYGYPLYLYYAPLPYYVMEVFHLLGISLINSVKIGYGLSVLISGLAMFALAKKLLAANSAAISAAVLYVYAPFRAADLFVRGAMGELWGMAVLPLLLWSYENLLTAKTKKSSVIFALSLAAYFLSHNLTVVMSLPLVAGWMIIRFVYSKDLKISELLFPIVLGGGLSAFFILPLIFERHLVHLETLTQGYFYYLNHFISVKQNFLYLVWGYGPSIVGSDDEVFLGIGPVHLLAAVGGIVLFLKRYFLKPATSSGSHKGTEVFISLLIIYFAASLYLTHLRSDWFWRLIPALQMLQFPWRFILISVFISSLLGGYLLKMSGPVLQKYLGISLVIGTMVLYLPFFQPKDWYLTSDADKLSGENRNRQITASIYDYLPKSAKINPADPAPAKPLIQSGEAEIKSFYRGTDWYQFNAEVTSSESEVIIPAYDFPHWEIKVNSGISDYQPAGELGLLLLKLSEGNHNVTVKLKNSLPRTAGDVLSAVSILVSGLFFVKGAYVKKS